MIVIPVEKKLEKKNQNKKTNQSQSQIGRINVIKREYLQTEGQL